MLSKDINILLIVGYDLNKGMIFGIIIQISKENNMKINARKLALRILDEIEGTNDFSHMVLSNTFKKYDIDPGDRRFISHLCLGVLENKLLLDYYIRKLSAQRFSRIHHSVVNILRMGLYQLTYMSKIPDSAAVDECVKLAKNISVKDASFVNGILRNYIRMDKKIELPNRKQHLVTHLSIKHSFPEWLVQMWLDEYGVAFTETLLAASNRTPNLSIRVNDLFTDRASYLDSLEAMGVKAFASDLSPLGIIIEDLNHLGIQDLPGFEDGFFTIQDISSMKVADMADIKPGMTVLDVCAAPGGKTTHVAQLMKQTGKVIARDVHEHKLSLIRENVERLMLKNVQVELFDAMILDETLIEQADVVLVDAPCSGLGIIRRKPDIKYNKTLEQLNSLVEMQKQILSTASHYVKNNGVLIYSTCTLNKSENQDVVMWFLEQNADYELDATPFMTLFPNTNQTDGFFIAKLIKK